jgi:hypothetical protein
MKKLNILTAVTAALTLTSGLAIANTNMMEPCSVMDSQGNNIIKAGKNDCKGMSHSCAGQAKMGDKDAYINVPKGECAKINTGDYTGISADTKSKIQGAM